MAEETNESEVLLEAAQARVEARREAAAKRKEKRESERPKARRRRAPNVPVPSGFGLRGRDDDISGLGPAATVNVPAQLAGVFGSIGPQSGAQIDVSPLLRNQETRLRAQAINARAINARQLNIASFEADEASDISEIFEAKRKESLRREETLRQEARADRQQAEFADTSERIRLENRADALDDAATGIASRKEQSERNFEQKKEATESQLEEFGSERAATNRQQLRDERFIDDQRRADADKSQAEKTAEAQSKGIEVFGELLEDDANATLADLDAKLKERGMSSVDRIRAMEAASGAKVDRLKSRNLTAQAKLAEQRLKEEVEQAATQSFLTESPFTRQLVGATTRVTSDIVRLRTRLSGTLAPGQRTVIRRELDKLNEADASIKQATAAHRALAQFVFKSTKALAGDKGQEEQDIAEEKRRKMEGKVASLLAEAGVPIQGAGEGGDQPIPLGDFSS